MHTCPNKHRRVQGQGEGLEREKTSKKPDDNDYLAQNRSPSDLGIRRKKRVAMKKKKKTRPEKKLKKPPERNTPVGEKCVVHLGGKSHLGKAIEKKTLNSAGVEVGSTWLPSQMGERKQKK